MKTNLKRIYVLMHYSAHTHDDINDDIYINACMEVHVDESKGMENAFNWILYSSQRKSHNVWTNAVGYVAFLKQNYQ